MNDPPALPARILIADDDRLQREELEATLRSWNYEVTALADGLSALKAIQDPAGPSLAILDWVMPGIEGVRLCQWVRERLPDRLLYLILLTAKRERKDWVAGLEAGADDLLTKPFNRHELRARLHAAERTLRMHIELARGRADLRASYHRIMRLEKLLPICSYCKSIRDDRSLWQGIDRYLIEFADARFTHGVCPSCFERVAREEFGLSLPVPAEGAAEGAADPAGRAPDPAAAAAASSPRGKP